MNGQISIYEGQCIIPGSAIKLVTIQDYGDHAVFHAAQRADELPTTGSREPPGSHFITPTTSTMSPLWDAWEALLSCVRQERISRANSGLSCELDGVESCQRG